MSDNNKRPEFDNEIQAIADYVLTETITSELAYETARLCLLDSIGCAIHALSYQACKKVLGPLVPDTKVKKGSRVIGTSFELDPVTAAFNTGAMIRWLDFNDTWLAAEWGHPSDNLGAILALGDYLSRHASKKNSLTMRDVLTAMIKAYEIQGILALENSFNSVGLDHVLLVKLASAAIASSWISHDRQKLLNTLTQVFVDGQALRTYRHAPNTGSRKSWAAGDAGARGVWLALMSDRGEMGYPSAITAKQWGFQDTLYKNHTLKRTFPYTSYVMENILFKVSFPAEFHAQTAVECAIQLHPKVIDRLDQIHVIELHTQESAMRIINKTGPLYNPADRDHSLQYMVAASLMKGDLKAEYYEDEFASQDILEILRDKIRVFEDKNFTKDYLDPDKRSIGNSLQIFFVDGTSTEKVTIEYPLGHRRRREEAKPFIREKFKKKYVASIYPGKNKIVSKSIRKSR